MRPGWRASRPARWSASPSAPGSCLAVRRDALGDGAAQRDHARLGAAGRQHARATGAVHDQPDAPGAADAEPPEHERDALGDVGLQPLGGAERHRGRDVEHDPRRHRPLGDVQADVRLAAGARGRRRVDVADIVADDIRPQLGELDPETDAGRAPVAGQRVREAARDRDVKRVDQRLRNRSRTLPRRGRLQQRLGHPAATGRASPTARVRWCEPGSGTTASTCSSISSAVTPSLSAS